MNKKLNLVYDFDESESDLLKKVKLPINKIKRLIFNNRSRVYISNPKELVEKELGSIFEVILAAFYECFSREDSRVLLNYGFIAGERISSLYNDELPDKYDLFLTEDLALDYLSLCKGPNKSNFRGNQFSIQILDKKKDLIELIISREGSSIRLNLMTKNYGSPEKTISKFDFVHCMSYYKWDLPIQLNEDVISSKRLIFNEEASFPLDSIMRIHRYCSNGWVISQNEIIKPGKAISKINFKSSREN